MDESRQRQIDIIKAAVGIESANCETCDRLGSDGDGLLYNGSWDICEKELPKQYLRSFPFKKEQPCWEPNFLNSRFVEHIHSEKDLAPAYAAFNEALEKAISEANSGANDVR